MAYLDFDAKIELEAQLLSNIKQRLPQLKTLLEESAGHWTYEDGIYRFYHQSFKVYFLQEQTLKIVEALKGLLDRPLNAWFLQIVAEGTGKKFVQEHNERWLEVTRPIVEAYFHALYFLQMICKYGQEREQPDPSLPSGWAAVLYLYDMR